MMFGIAAVVGPVFILGVAAQAGADGAEMPVTSVSPEMLSLLRALGCVLFFVVGGSMSLLLARAGLNWETVLLDEDALSIEHSVLSRTRKKRYLRKYIGGLHVPDDVPEEIEEGEFSPGYGGVLAFQYGSQTVFFGPEVTKSEAEGLLAKMLDAAPDLAKPPPILDHVEEQSADWKRYPDCVSPVADRFTLESTAKDIRITIPSRSSSYGRMFMAVWLVGWAGFVVFALGVLWSSILRLRSGVPIGENESDPKMAIGFVGVWLFFWMMGGALVLWTVAWAKWGRQVIEITPSSINISNRSPLWRTRRTIDRQHAGPIHMRTSLGYFSGLQLKSDRGDSAASGGWLECRERRTKHHFGAGLTRREAEYLLMRLHRIDPSLVELAPA